VRARQHLSGKLFLGIGAVCVFIAFGAVNLSFLRAQTPIVGEHLKFEVASIKSNKSGSRASDETLGKAGGYVTFTNATVRQLIEKAYFPYNRGWSAGLKSLMPAALPNWTDSERFDIEARVNGNPTVVQKQLMLQSLLLDRFKLTTHNETRQLSVYALVLTKPGKTGPQLLPHTSNTCAYPLVTAQPPAAGAAVAAPCGAFLVQTRPDSPGAFFPRAFDMTMPWFAQNLTPLVGRLVVDRTGLSGGFDLNFGYTPGPGEPGASKNPEESSSQSDQPSIFTALQEQLGLKLEPQTAPVELVFVDHIEEPSAN
jgi:uncharacterized protein (TIGR03435 family)